MRAATAAAEPPDDPPATQFGSHGLRVGPNAECSVDEPMANSSRFVFPISDAPCWRSRAITVASNGETKSPRMREAQVVGMSVVTMLSLMAIGNPSPEAWRFTCRNACSCGSRASIAAMQAPRDPGGDDCSFPSCHGSSRRSLTADHLRHDEKSVDPIGRIALGERAIDRRPWRVLAERRRIGRRMLLEALDVDLAQLIDVREDLRH